MADKKITQLNNITGANLVDADEFVVVDISADETKAITLGELKEAFDAGSGFVRVTGDTMTGDLSFGDDDKAIFGTGGASPQLQIYTDGSNSYIDDAGAGNLRILAGDLRIRNSANTEAMISATEDAAVTLFYDGEAKLATSVSGIDVTGAVTADGLTVEAGSGGGDGSATPIGLTISDLSSGSSWVAGDITSAVDYTSADGSGAGAGIRVRTGIAPESTGGGTNSYYIQTAPTTAGTMLDRLRVTSNGDLSLYDSTGTTPKFFWDASAESLGIGTTSPLAGRIAEFTSAGDAQVRISTTTAAGDARLELIADSGGVSQIRFGDEVASNTGILTYTHSNNSMSFNTNSGTRMTLDSSGNLDVTGTVTANTVSVSKTAGHGAVEVGGPSGGLIDLKAPFSDDYDARIIYNAGDSLQIVTLAADEPIILRQGLATKLATSASGIDVTGKVASNVSTTGDFNFLATSTGGGSFRIYPDDATTANPTWYYQSNSSEDQAWVIGGVERMRLASDDLTVTGSVNVGNDLNITGPSPVILLTDDDVADESTRIQNASGSTFIDSRNGTANGAIVFRGNGGGVNDEYARFIDNGYFGIGTIPSSPLHIDTNADGNILQMNGASDAWELMARSSNGSSPASGEVIYSFGMYRSDGASSPNGVINFGRGSSSQNGYLTFDVNGSESMRIDSSGNLGIGTATPDTLLHLAASNGGITTAGTGNNTLRFEDRDPTKANGQVTGTIDWYTNDDTATGVQAWITADSTNVGAGSLAFGTGVAGATAERMRINSLGNVGIGTSSPKGLLELSAITGSGSLNLVSTQNATDAGQKIAFFGADRSDADEEMAYIQGLLVGNSGGAGNVQTGQLAFGTSGTEAMRITSAGDLSLTGGGGIIFGDAGASGTPSPASTSNTLDDYEEGTWSPVIGQATSGTPVGSATVTSAHYTKVGRQVTLSVQLTNIVTTGMTSTSPFFVRNLPFTSKSDNFSSCAVKTDRLVFQGGRTNLYGQVGGNDTWVNFQVSGSGVTEQNVDIGDTTSGTTDIAFSLTYITA